MSGNRIAEDPQQLVLIELPLRYQCRRKWFAITLGFIICTTFVTLARPLPRGICAQTMKVRNGREREEKVVGLREIEASEVLWMRRREERRLNGPGSHPPSCKSKCGRCVPCKPVHVPIHPGRKRPLEYYPEAWRCKCGNKLYMP